MIPFDPADLNDSDKPDYQFERKDLQPLVDYWFPRLGTMTRKQLQDLLVTTFWVGKED